VAEWFNPTAPPITAGAVNPEMLSPDTALALMVEQPILIRRPLLQVGDRYAFGFDLKAVDAWIGLNPNLELSQDVQSCPHRHGA